VVGDIIDVEVLCEKR